VAKAVRLGLVVAAIGLAAVGIAASGVYAIATGRDDVMDGLCSIPSILHEEAFLTDRTAFYWLATSGERIERLGASVPGYEPESGAQFEEMPLDRVTVGALANVAIGRGRAWAGPAIPPTGAVVDAPDEARTLLPPGGEPGHILLFESVGIDGNCTFHNWLAREIERAGEELSAARDEDRVPIDIRAELEVSVSEALASLRAAELEGRCLQARWVPRDELPLRAYRVYETREAGLVNYWLSPHIITSDGHVVYFSMGVVRTSAVYDALGIEAPDPLERTCCVGACSRFGGPDPYMADVRRRRAIWQNSRLPRPEGE